LNCRRFQLHFTNAGEKSLKISLEIENSDAKCQQIADTRIRLLRANLKKEISHSLSNNSYATIILEISFLYSTLDTCTRYIHTNIGEGEKGGHKLRFRIVCHAT